ncbi:hypothetical protein ALO49_200201 [Pseudomonas savastanoi pv. retacarpa]|nr:hypothetical protein ALO49_200201 [Pseudomonas savastanoi pv. retacarpa]
MPAVDAFDRLHSGHRQTGIRITEHACIHCFDRGCVVACNRGDAFCHSIEAPVTKLQNRVDIQHRTGSSGKAHGASGGLGNLAWLPQTQDGLPLKGLLVGGVRQNLVGDPVLIAVQPVGRAAVRTGQYPSIGLTQRFVGEVDLSSVDQRR